MMHKKHLASSRKTYLFQFSAVFVLFTRLPETSQKELFNTKVIIVKIYIEQFYSIPLNPS